MQPTEQADQPLDISNHHSKNKQSGSIHEHRDVEPYDYYMDELFMKYLPPISSRMTFSGEGEEDHMEFVDWVDSLET